MARSSCSFGIAREVAAGVGLDDRLELLGEGLEVGGGEVRVLLGAVGRLRGLERVVEPLALHVHDDPAEHLDEPPVGVPAEPLVAGQRDQAVERLLVQAEVEDRVHHPGHRELRARADADEERVGGVAEALAGRRLDLLDGLEHVVPETVREALAGREVVVAGLGRDREAGRHREARDWSSRRGPRPCRRAGRASTRRPRPSPRPRRRCSASPRDGRAGRQGWRCRSSGDLLGGSAVGGDGPWRRVGRER